MTEAQEKFQSVQGVDELGITPTENAQIEALKRGATPEQASLGGRLPVITPVEPLDITQVVDALEESPLSSRDNVDLNKKALDLTITRSGLAPTEDTKALYDDSLRILQSSANIDRTLEDFRKLYADQQKAYVAEAAVNAAATGQASIEDSAEFLQVLDDMGKELEGLHGQEQIFGDVVAPDDLSEYSKNNRIASNYAWSRYADWAEKKGVVSKGVDWLSLLFVPDFLKDANDLVDGNLFNTKKKMMFVINAYHGLDPKDKPKAFDDIFERVVEAYDSNYVKIGGFLSLLESLDPSTDFNIGVAGDAFDIATSLTAAKATKFVKNRLTRRVEPTPTVIKESTAAPAKAATPSEPGVPGEPIPSIKLKPTKKEIEDVKKDFINEVKAELIAGTSQKLTRGQRENLAREIADSQFKLRNDTLTQNARTTLEGRIKNAKAQLDADEIGSRFEADLSRIEQGIIPEPYNTRLNQLITEIENGVTEIKPTPLSQAIRTIGSTIKGTDPVQKMKNMGNDTLASIASKADEVNPDKVTQATNESPFNFGSLFAFLKSTDGLSREGLALREASLNAIKALQGDIANAKSEDFLATVQYLKEGSKTAAINREKAALNALNEKGKAVYGEITAVDVNDKGFTLQYTLDGKPVSELREWKVSDIGTFMESNPKFKENNKLTSLLQVVLSPDFVLNNVDPSIVRDITAAGLQSTRLKAELTRVFNNINKGLSRAEIRAVDELIIAGDEADVIGGKIFTLEELAQTGVELASGTRVYSTKEIENYYKKIAFGKELHDFKNATIRKAMEFEGIQEIQTSVVSDLFPRNLLGKIGEDFRSLPSDLPGNEMLYAPQLSKGNFIRAGDLDIDKLSSDGFKPVRLVSQITDGKSRVKWAIVKDEGTDGKVSFNPLPPRVLNYIPGAVPRHYRPGYYFVKDFKDGSTKRVFERKKDAEAWRVAETLKQETQAIPVKDRVTLVTLNDRDLSRFDSIVEEANFYGGLYTGARKKSEPLMLYKSAEEKGTKLERMSYGDSMQRYISNISDLMPINEYRMALRERFINTVNAIAKKEGASFGIKPDADWRDTPINITDNGLRRQMEFTRDYLMNQFRIWSKEESAFNGFMMDLAAFSEGKLGFIGDNVAKSAVILAHKDPIKAMRGATFHAHLGWFNIRQLYIQAQNAALAVSMHPIHGIGAVSDMVSMHALIRLPDDVLETIKTTNKFGLGNMVDEVREFKRSGLATSILENADYAASAQGFTPSTMNAVRGAAKKGLVFYQHGELTSRMIAWGVAKRNLGKHGKRISDAEMFDVLDETFRMHMNLQRENAAWWQRNILAIPTQFFQVQAKLIENVIGSFTKSGKWTKKEAASVAAGQILLYGTLGVPLAEDLSEYIIGVSGMTSEELQKKHPNLAEALADGAQGVLFQMLGFENQFGGDTASLLAGLDDNVIADLISGSWALFSGQYTQDTLGRAAFGPTVNTLGRTSDAVINAVQNLQMFWHTPKLDQVGPALLETLDDFAAISSTWSNARKARYLFKTGEVYSKAGNVIIGPDKTRELNLISKIAMGMGFPLDITASYYALAEKNRNISQDMAATVKDLKKAAVLARNTGNIEKYQILQGMLLAGFSDFEQIQIKDRLRRDLVNSLQGDELDKEVRKFVDNLVRGQGKYGDQVELINLQENKQKKNEQ